MIFSIVSTTLRHIAEEDFRIKSKKSRALLKEMRTEKSEVVVGANCYLARRVSNSYSNGAHHDRRLALG